MENHIYNPSRFLILKHLWGITAGSMLLIHPLISTGQTQLTSDVTTNTQFMDDVVVPSGHTVTISATASFAADKSLTIEPNARLFIDGGKLTNSSDTPTELWQGVIINGDVNESQFPPAHPDYQGYIELSNGAVIENAMRGIFNVDGGGVIRSFDAVLKNNLTGLNFQPYTELPNYSIFVNTQFIVDDNYIGGDFFLNHVFMAGNNGIAFYGCDFVWETPSASEPVFSFWNGIGINAFRSSVYVTGCSSSIVSYCAQSQKQPSIFSGLNYGVFARGASESIAMVDVSWSSFENNARGIEIRSIDYIGIFNNDFEMGAIRFVEMNKDGHPHFLHSGDMSDNEPHIGIELRNSQGYRIEENEFSRTETLGGGNIFPVGITVSNSGEIRHADVYKNQFVNLEESIIARGVNAGSFWEETEPGIWNVHHGGLEILCNEFDNHTIYPNSGRDFRSWSRWNDDNDENESARIKLNQGSFTNPAGNKFSVYGINGWNIDNWSGERRIRYHYEGEEGLGNPFFPMKIVYANLIQSDQEIESICLTRFFPHWYTRLTIPERDNFELTFDYHDDRFSQLLTSYNSQIDDGNTSSLLSAIPAYGTEPEMMSFLSAFSPWLSTDVLAEAAQTGVLSSQALTNLSLQNPDATSYQSFLELLEDEIPNPLDESQIDQIKDSWGLVTSRTQVKDSISFHLRERGYAINTIIIDEKLDSSRGISELKHWLTQDGSIEAYYNIEESYVFNNEFDQAYSVLNNIKANFNLTYSQQSEKNKYKEIIEFMEGIYLSGKTLFDLTVEEIDELKDIAYDRKGRAAVIADNILCFIYHICLADLIPESEQLALTTTKYVVEEKNKSELSVYPNPSNRNVKFKWVNLHLYAEEGLTLTITNMKGRSVITYLIKSTKGEWIWDAIDEKPGIYLYNISGMQDGKLQRIHEGKILVR